MSTVVLAVNSSTYDSEDRVTAKEAVTLANTRITQANTELARTNNTRAQNVPPLDPIPAAPLWPVSTVVEIRDAYQEILAVELTDLHKQKVTQTLTRLNAQAPTSVDSLKSAWAEATEAKRIAARAAALAALA